MDELANIRKKPDEVAAKCDHPNEVVANCDHPQETALSQYDIEKLIITVRGEQVLIDQEIARIYGVTTGRLNEQAKRNIARFPESFRFQLTKEERDEVIANCENLRSLKFYPSLPYAYTEQGIGQLSTVVHSKIAIERSIMIMNAFVALLGASVKDMGVGMCAVTKMQVSPETVLQLLK